MTAESRSLRPGGHPATGVDSIGTSTLVHHPEAEPFST
jgi:hypothetical protein